LSAAKLPALALTVGLIAASAALPWAQEPAPQTPPAQPAQPASQPDAAKQAPAQQTTPAATPAATPAQAPASATPDATQTQTPASTAPQNRATSVVKPTPKTPSGTTTSGPAPSASDSILESELRTLLVDKPLFLRGCYLSDDLRFNERGGLYDSSPRGSFTLSGIQIESLRLTKRELILEGDRYGYRFLGALPGNNPTDDMERIKITPKKKMLRIRIEREEVIAPKKEKEKAAKPQPGQSAPATKPPADAQATSAPANAAPAADAAAAPAADSPGADSAKTEPLKDEPVTTSPEHAVARLKEALGRLFTPSLDDRFVGSMPPFWQLYYKDLATKADYHPSDSSVLRQNLVDKKARLISSIDPPSNSLAQEFGVAGQALYHVVVGPDGKPGEIAIGQPIGFGLDENAVETLKRATFAPAVKDGKNVPVVLDLIVQFHIYSKLTSGTSKADQSAKPALPGPYSLPPKP
jgi:outer membrane biosynthesis protein TonB